MGVNNNKKDCDEKLHNASLINIPSEQAVQCTAWINAVRNVAEELVTKSSYGPAKDSLSK